MSVFIAFLATVLVALAAVAVGVPDRWLVWICLIVFVIVAVVLHGAGSEAHA